IALSAAAPNREKRGFVSPFTDSLAGILNSVGGTASQLPVVGGIGFPGGNPLGLPFGTIIITAGTALESILAQLLGPLGGGLGGLGALGAIAGGAGN
ncbi:hypothetical protein PFISCL1PPCAC_3757, partial [Pristionchus fissidentatus]